MEKSPDSHQTIQIFPHVTVQLRALDQNLKIEKYKTKFVSFVTSAIYLEVGAHQEKLICLKEEHSTTLTAPIGYRGQTYCLLLGNTQKSSSMEVVPT